MSADRNYRGVRSQITWAEELPVEQDLATGTIDGTSITGITICAEHAYAGQVATAIPRNATPSGADGKRFHIVSNTASAMVFEEDVEAAGLTVAYDLVVTQRNVTQTGNLDAYFGHVEETELPERKIETFKGWYKGSDNQPWRHEIIPLKATYESSIPLRLVSGRILAMALGYVEDSGANATTYTDTTANLANPSVPGQRTLTSDTAHGLVTGDYVQVGNASQTPEIRQCTSGTTGSTIVLSEPLRREHAHDVDLYEVALGTGYIVHTLKPYDIVPYWQLKRTLFSYKTNSVLNDYVKVYRGLKCKSVEFSISPGDAPLAVTMNISGLSIDDATETARETVDYAGFTNLTPFIHKGAITKINDVIYKQSGDFSGTVERDMQTKYYHEEKKPLASIKYGSDSTYGYLDPTEHIEGTVSSNFTLNMPLHNKSMWELLRAMSQLSDSTETSHYLSRGTNDNMSIRFYGVFMTDGPEGMPREGEIPLNLTFDASHPIITIKDAVMYY